MNSNSLKSVLSSSIGNVLEWYEYTLYAYFATVISKLFFPLDNHFVAMVMTFATFAIGLAARPIGGIIFGYLGDRYSRKKTLSMTMLLMSIPTTCMGLLPTYEHIGIAAPVLLITLRILQGVALGGEFGASCVYLYESVPENKRGFFGSIALTGVGTGLVLSACTIFLVESLVTEETLYSYGWRIPFFISVIGSIVAFYMRRNLLETKDFIAVKQSNDLVANPLFEMFKNHKATLAGLFAIFLTTQVSFFVVFIYGKTMMMDFLHFDSYTAGKFNISTLISYTIATVIFGYLSDKINKRYIILFGAVGILLAAYPFIAALKFGAAEYILLMSMALGALIGMTEGTLNPLVAESFPTNIRATSVAFCWNFTSVSFGGVAPILAMWLIENAGGIDAVAYYLMTVCALTVIGLSITILRTAKKTPEISVFQRLDAA
ncbi:MFS transporter [Candidatus Finniella inopinata]|uniref:MFS transporter n=1 Tax=Candidatus Finniella inopinata TaxID=1696036 RepID=A0A4Q7DHW1_9PROT|nr:MFS transporter [Candidatus Finniella inopinata]RZI45524.1 MFS transporter [Candidatus Finniella inopinata]